MGKTAIVIGATGLVGNELVKQLIDSEQVDQIKVFGRRKTGIVHPKLHELIIDFDDKAGWQDQVTGDVLFSALGTTLKQAKSKTAQYKVDYTYQYDFANAAAKNGVPVYVLVSSSGANPTSFIFYSRMKGELEVATQTLPFKKWYILQPSVLTGKREKQRTGEILAAKITNFVTHYILKSYKPISGEIVARGMINAAFSERIPKNQVIESDNIFILAEQID